MPLTNSEFASILADVSKYIDSDIDWSKDEDHSPAWQFRAEIKSKAGWPLFVKGRYNFLAGSLNYALILRTVGRIYALDLGKDHHNPGCEQIGEKHKHRWTERFRDKEAYVPDDITALATDPASVWSQFCAEARIEHRGRLNPLPSQGDLFL